jgi:hypothetical protein
MNSSRVPRKLGKSKDAAPRRKTGRASRPGLSFFPPRAFFARRRLSEQESPILLG